MLHVHVLLAAPLGTGHMAQPGKDQHEGGVSVREAPHRTGAAMELPVQPLNDFVGTNASSVFGGKIAVGKRLLHVVLYLLGSILQFL